MLAGDKGKANQATAVQITAVKIYSGDLAVSVGGVVVDSLGGVAARGVKGDVIFAVLQLAAATLLGHGAKDVKELADAFFLGGS